ncbi:hypothetical protein AAH476_24490, partial [Enterobacter cloacae subsp. cloacae]
RLPAIPEIRHFVRHLSVSNVSWQIAVPNNRTALSAVFFTSHRILLQVNRLFLHHYHPVNGSARTLTHG